MALPNSATWDLADFSGSSLSLMTLLSPSLLTLLPSASPYFSYDGAAGILTASSSNGVECSLEYKVAVPTSFTVEAVIRLAPPITLGDLTYKHIGLTVANDSGRGISLYFAKTGIAISRVDLYGGATALPDTADVTSDITTEFYTVRVAVDGSAGRAYVFASPGETTNPSLRWIVPVEQTPPSIQDLFKITVLGLPVEPATLEFKALRLATGLVLAAVPPVADAGTDRVFPVGQAGRLDGRASYDVHGGSLTYKWRATDAPFGSTFAEDCFFDTTDDGDSDGVTPTLVSQAALPDWVTAGDVVRLQGATLEVAQVLDSHTILLTTDDAPDTLSSASGRIISQLVLIGATTELHGVVPDIAGIYRFELVVNSNEVQSEPAEVLVNVTATQAPLGIEPDVKAIWKAIGDEWQHIDGHELFEEAWRGVAQLLSGKLLEAWQYHYNSSIRDAQRVFQRKWVAFRTFVGEASPEKTARFGDTTDTTFATYDPRWGYLLSSHEFDVATLAANFSATVYSKSTDSYADVVVTTTGLGAIAAASAINSRLSPYGILAEAIPSNVDDPALRFDTTVSSSPVDTTHLTTVVTVAAVPSWLAVGDLFAAEGVDRTAALRITSISGGTTLHLSASVPDTLDTTACRLYRACRLVLRANAANPSILYLRDTATGFTANIWTRLKGNAGVRVSDTVYYVGGEINLNDFGVTRNDLLMLNNGQSFSIDRIFSDPLDPQPYQRVLLFDALPLDATAEWAIPSAIVSAANDYELLGVYPGDLARFEVQKPGASISSFGYGTVVAQKGSTLAVDLWPTVMSGILLGAALRFEGVRLRKLLLVDDDINSVPRLQDLIPTAAGPVYLKENVDYFLEPVFRASDSAPSNALQFIEFYYSQYDNQIAETFRAPPDILWAELVLYTNEKNVENLFGRLVGFLRDDAATFPRDFNYVAGIAGLLYAQQRGPTVFAAEVGAQILLGQPFAEVSGYVEEVRFDYSPFVGRIILRDDDGNVPTTSEVVRAYYYTKIPSDVSNTSGLAINPDTNMHWAIGDFVPQFSPLGAGIEIVDIYSEPKWWVTYARSHIVSELEKFHTYLVRFDLDVVHTTGIALLSDFLFRIKPKDTRTLLSGVRATAEALDVIDKVAATITIPVQDSVSNARAFTYDDMRGDGTTTSAYDDGYTYFDGIVDTPLDLIDLVCYWTWPGGTVHTAQFPSFIGATITDVTGSQTSIVGGTFTLTDGMTLAAGDYQIVKSVKTTGVVLSALAITHENDF